VTPAVWDFFAFNPPAAFGPRALTQASCIQSIGRFNQVSFSNVFIARIGASKPARPKARAHAFFQSGGRRRSTASMLTAKSWLGSRMK
jgi:hypothetical protein